MAGGDAKPRAWTTGRVVGVVVGSLVVFLGVLLIVWGLGMIGTVLLLPMGIVFTLVGAVLAFVGGALAGITWSRVLRRGRRPIPA